MNYKVTIFIALLLTSCQSIYSTIDGVNKTKSFNSNNEYATHYSNKIGININKIYFCETPNDLSTLFQHIHANNLTYFYGLKKDTIVYRLKSDIKTNSCYGLINSVVNEKNFESDKFSKTSYSLNENKLYNINNQNPSFTKPCAIFIISDKLGNTIHNDIKDIVSNIDNSTTDYILISVDRLNSN